jgi:mRNA interferase RelE/StbE
VNYRIVILPSAQKELGAIPAQFFESLEERIHALGDNPRPPGCKKMRDSEAVTWRIRSGNYRVVYEIDDSAKIVTIQRVGHRREVYR